MAPILERPAVTRQVLEYLDRTYPGLQPSAHTELLDSVLFDSLAILKTVMFLEETFELDMTRKDFDLLNFQTPGAMVEMVMRKS